MTIVRRRHSRNYTVIGNEVFSDERLELDALGLLCWLRSRPHDWSISLAALRNRFDCGPEKMQRLMRALMALGWVQRQRGPRGPFGTFGGFEYVVLDEPDQRASAQPEPVDSEDVPQSDFPLVASGLAAPESGSPTPADPESADPESVEPESANPTPYKVRILPRDSPLNPPVAGGTRSDEAGISEPKVLAGRKPDPDRARRPRAERSLRGSQTPTSAPSPETAARFEQLWLAYPVSGRLAANRAQALARFASLDPISQEAAIRAASLEARVRAETRAQARALHRWLRDGLFRNGDPPSASPGAASPQRVFVREGSTEWSAWADHYRRIGRVMPVATRIGGQDGWRFDSARPPEPAPDTAIA